MSDIFEPIRRIKDTIAELKKRPEMATASAILEQLEVQLDSIQTDITTVLKIRYPDLFDDTT